MLQRYHRRHAAAEMSQAIDQLAELIRALAALTLNESQSIRPLATGDNRIEGTALEVILGIEGAGSGAYFQCFGKVIAEQNRWPFARRIKRPPNDPVNSLLSFVYDRRSYQVARC